MEGSHRLKRTLGPISLTALGVGAIIGTGIFVLVGKAAANQAGPAIMLSFVVAGLPASSPRFVTPNSLRWLRWLALLTTMPTQRWRVDGLDYRLDLILEYAVASSTVAHGWSKYMQKLLEQLKINWVLGR